MSLPRLLNLCVDGRQAQRRVIDVPNVEGATAEHPKAQQAWNDTTSHLGSIEATPTDPAAVPFYAAGAPR